MAYTTPHTIACAWTRNAHRSAMPSAKEPTNAATSHGHAVSANSFLSKYSESGLSDELASAPRDAAAAPPPPPDAAAASRAAFAASVAAKSYCGPSHAAPDVIAVSSGASVWPWNAIAPPTKTARTVRPKIQDHRRSCFCLRREVEGGGRGDGEEGGEGERRGRRPRRISGKKRTRPVARSGEKDVPRAGVVDAVREGRRLDGRVANLADAHDEKTCGEVDGAGEQ